MSMMKFRYRWPLKLLVFGFIILTTIQIMGIVFVVDENRTSNLNAVCKIPHLDPWDASTVKYTSSIKSEKPQCSAAYNIMFVNDSGFLHYNKSALHYYSLDDRYLRCNYQIIERLMGDKQVKLGTRRRFVLPSFINSTYFRVSCFNNNTLVYDLLHVNPFWIADPTRENEIGDENDHHYSVLLIGIDSVSRSHAIRYLPKSFKYLKEELGAYDLKGYMKVGSNSFPNLIPLLTGMQHSSFLMVDKRLSYCDSLPLLWKEESLVRYAKLYSEDRVDISAFNTLEGFYASPTDFYYRPYNLAMDLFTPVIINPMNSSKSCYANADNFTVQVNHFKGFLNRFKGKLKFTFFWANAAHESFDLLQNLDNTLLELLQWLQTHGHLERAMVAVLSDHGIRLGDFSESYLGRLESHFPFLSLIVPQKLEKKYPEIRQNLLLNINTLTTPYDIHKTFLDIAKQHYDSQVAPIGKGLIARNLLFNVIPKARTCADAGVPPNYCRCVDDGKKLSSTDELLVKPLAVYAVDHINSRLADHTDICRRLTLHNITEARVQYACLETDEKKVGLKSLIDSFRRYVLVNLLDSEKCGKSGRYNLLFRTKPGEGLFQAMVEFTEVEQKSKLSVVGDIVRINRYQGQSDCVSDDHVLKQYCYCKSIK